MPSDIDRIVEGFPHPTIPPTIGRPEYAQIAEVNLKLNANAASVQSELGNGALGLLSLTVKPAVYNTHSAVPFVAPANPGPTVVIPVGPPNPTSAVVSNLTRAHNENLRVWREYLATDKALKQQLLSCFNESYYRTMRNRVTGFANVTTLVILTHLYDTYGRLTPQDMTDNHANMTSDYDAATPIETMFDQVEDAIDLAAAANVPYSPAQIVNIGYSLMFNTGLFPDAMRDWRKRIPVDKTWANFKIDMAEAHQELRESQVTSNQAGFHNANNVKEFAESTTEVLEKLSESTDENKQQMNNITAQNTRLSTDLASAIQALQVAAGDIWTLKQQIQTYNGQNSPSSTIGGSTIGTTPTQLSEGSSSWATRETVFKQRTKKKFNNTNYCWSHGYDIAEKHTSGSCKKPAIGHQKTATKDNNMGGTDKFKDLVWQG